MMSTWGCYFCCVLLFFFFLNCIFLVSLLPCEVCIIFFFLKTLNVFQKILQTRADNKISFSSEDFKKSGNKNIVHKGFHFTQRWKRKKKTKTLDGHS